MTGRHALCTDCVAAYAQHLGTPPEGDAPQPASAPAGTAYSLTCSFCTCAVNDGSFLINLLVSRRTKSLSKASATGNLTVLSVHQLKRACLSHPKVLPPESNPDGGRRRSTAGTGMWIY